jgi:dTDP-4-amino-4,6-dideoxygalactose transaminase
MKRCGFAGEDQATNGKALDATLNELHAAMALASLDEIDEQIVGNKRKYSLYVAGLRNIDGISVVEHKDAERPDYRLIVVRIDDGWPLSRDDTLRVLEAENILARPYYTPLTHRLVEYPRICPDLPVTEAIFRDFMVLPSGAHVSEDDVEKIVGVLARIDHRTSEFKPRGKAK